MAHPDQERWTDEIIGHIQSLADDETVDVGERMDNLGTIEDAIDSARDLLNERLEEGAE